MKTPTLIGTIILAISLLIAVIAIFRLDFLDQSLEQKEYFDLFFIWICGVVGGIGLGYGNRESFGYGEGNTGTIIGGLGLAGCIVISALMFIYENPPLQGVIITFISAILALIGLYMMVVSTQESY